MIEFPSASKVNCISAVQVIINDDVVACPGKLGTRGRFPGASRQAVSFCPAADGAEDGAMKQ